MTIGQTGWLRSGHRVTVVDWRYVQGRQVVTVRLSNGQSMTVQSNTLAVRVNAGSK